jgi:hypothetical protein
MLWLPTKKALKKPSAIGRDGFGYNKTSLASICASNNRSKYNLYLYGVEIWAMGGLGVTVYTLLNRGEKNTN